MPQLEMNLFEILALREHRLCHVGIDAQTIRLIPLMRFTDVLFLSREGKGVPGEGEDQDETTRRRPCTLEEGGRGRE